MLVYCDSGVKLYINKSIDRRWRNMLRNNESRVTVFSPYLTSPTAESVLAESDPNNCEIHTLFSADVFVSGGSSIRTLRQLLNRGFSVFHVEDLHAKLVIVAGKAATVGSQNLTSKGIRNLEASALILDRTGVLEVERSVRTWIEKRRRIYLDELLAMEKHVKPLRRKYLELQREISKINQSIAAAHELRIRHERARQEVIERTLKGLEQLIPDGLVPLEFASELIAGSIWWLTHKHGPVRARNYASRIEGSPDDWRLTIGANQFLVGRAAARCGCLTRDFLQKLKTAPASPMDELFSSLRSAVARAVANTNGEEYRGQYGAFDGRELRFGAQAIDINDFIGVFTRRCGIDALIRELANLGRVRKTEA